MMKVGQITEEQLEILEQIDVYNKDVISGSIEFTQPPHAIGDDAKYYVSEEHLKSVISLPYENALPDPRLSGLVSVTMDGVTPKHLEWVKKRNSLINDLGNILSCRQNALSAYYKPKTGINWHHNGDLPGRNLLFTWSETGNGFFRHRDVDGSIVDIQDKKGWSVKSGLFRRTSSEKFPPSWHCAWTECHRFTIAYVIYDNDMSRDLFEEMGMEYEESEEKVDHDK